MASFATVGLQASTKLQSCTGGTAPKAFPLVQSSLPQGLTSNAGLSQEVSVVNSKFFVSYSSLIKAAKIFAGVLVVSAAIVTVAVLCLKFFPVLILALVITGVICMIQNSNSAKVASSFSLEQAIVSKLQEHKNEKGTYVKAEIPNMAKRREKDQNQLGAFSSFIPGQPAFPYTITGVDNHEDTDEIFGYFTNKAVGTSDPQQVVLYLEDEGTEAQKRARHICSYLKLLGDGNQIANPAMVKQLSEFGYFVGEAPFTPGKLSASCIQQENGELFLSYVVTNEEIGIYKMEDMFEAEEDTFKAEKELVVRLKTSRRVVVSAPDKDGNVSYTIQRTFTRI